MKKKKKCCLKRQIEIAFVHTVGQAVKDHVLFNSVKKAIDYFLLSTAITIIIIPSIGYNIESSAPRLTK